MPEPNLPALRVLIDQDSKSVHKNVNSKHLILDLHKLKDKVPLSPQKERVHLMEKYGLSDEYAYNLVVSIFHFTISNCDFKELPGAIGV